MTTATTPGSSTATAPGSTAATAPGSTAATAPGSSTATAPALSAATTGALTAAGLEAAGVRSLVASALAEDLGDAGDITSAATVPAASTCTVEVVPRGAGVVAGLPVLLAVADLAPGQVTVQLLAGDRDAARPGVPIARLAGNTRAVLSIERTALNLLGHLSGVATLTAAWVAAVAGTGARVRDTRKTLPGLRALDKYAVRCGGGVNHRTGLFDAVLVKDNHVAAAGGVGAALTAVAAVHPRGSVVVQVEVDDSDQLDEALEYGAGQVLLDNFGVEALTAAVSRTRAARPGVLLEASGGLTLDSAAAVAATGVDLLAVGALTHSAPQLDIGLDWIA